MAIGHDILIKVDHKIKPYIYRVLVDYVGKNNPKEYPKETTFKNGIRIIRHNCPIAVSKGQVRKWAQTRLYFARHTIVMDIEVSTAIFNALLVSLYNIPGKKDTINALLSNHFDIIKNDTEEYSRRLTILEDIYRELLRDASNNNTSATLCHSLKNVEDSYN